MDISSYRQRAIHNRTCFPSKYRAVPISLLDYRIDYKSDKGDLPSRASYQVTFKYGDVEAVSEAFITETGIDWVGIEGMILRPCTYHYFLDEEDFKKSDDIWLPIYLTNIVKVYMFWKLKNEKDKSRTVKVT